MGRGGAETMIMNYYRALNRDEFQFDFLVHRKERAEYDDEIESMGGNIFRTMPIRPGNYIKYFHFLDNFFKEHAKDYVAVHCHIQENSGFIAKYAAKYGIKNRLCTSHIADLGIDYKFPFRLFGKCVGHNYITHRLACGQRAGKYMYGKKSFIIFPNAIDTQRFIFNKDEYNKFRKQKGWENDFVIGNVSRFYKQKNHTFIIDIFYELKKIKPNSRLVLVGDGLLLTEIKEKVHSLHLEDSVCFEGSQSDVPKYLKTMDVLLFPSLFEGLPVSIIEAQASGLKCFLSDTIDRDVDVTGDIIFTSLDKTAKDWAQVILQNSKYERRNNYNKIVTAGYDVFTNVNKLLSLYTQNI